jgi:type II secretory pathway pseudopilin PulG
MSSEATAPSSSATITTEDAIHANRHIPAFLALPDSSAATVSGVVQVVEDGKTLTAQRLLQNTDITLTRPILVNDSPRSIGMKVLSFPKRHVSVRDIADIIGHTYPVHVIDVEHQEELDGWIMADLVDYFEDEERLLHQHQQEVSLIASIPTVRSQRRRKAAEKCSSQIASRPRVLNQISLEFSKTPLKDKILSPKFVRDMDWIDHAWPGRQTEKESVYPNVQYYCLTSAAGCYTDFHVDFGGTAVWYHIMSGKKHFCLMKPTKENLAIYEDWLCRPNQAELFLPDMIKNKDEILRLSLNASQTLIIPTGWIHAVYTPVDSVVLGGNFLHGLDISLQLQIHCIEARTRVQEKFRFPHYLPLNFYAGGMYLTKLRRGIIAQREVAQLSELIHALDEWWKVQSKQSYVKSGPSVQAAAEEAAAQNNCASVEEFLKELRGQHDRVVQHGIKKDTKPMSSLTTTPSSGAKPKLRLKLPLSNDTAASSSSSAKNAAISPKGDGRLRITLSASAVKASSPLPAHAVVARHKKAREDTDWYADEGVEMDDDWEPSNRKKRGLPTTTTTTTSSTPTAQSDGKQPKTAVAVAKQPPPKAVNARQRLLKRFR